MWDEAGMYRVAMLILMWYLWRRLATVPGCLWYAYSTVPPSFSTFLPQLMPGNQGCCSGATPAVLRRYSGTTPIQHRHYTDATPVEPRGIPGLTPTKALPLRSFPSLRLCG